MSSSISSTIDNIPLPDASVDCVISNCVLNLAPDKPAVFREIARILKPGGRLAVSDIALKHELPEAVSRSMAAYVGCIAGAIRIDDYRAGLLAAGFEHVEIVDSGSDLNAYAKVENQSGCCSPAMVRRPRRDMQRRRQSAPVLQLLLHAYHPGPATLHEALRTPSQLRRQRRSRQREGLRPEARIRPQSMRGTLLRIPVAGLPDCS